MTELKHQILTEVYKSKRFVAISRTDFYKDTKKINLYKQNIDELIATGLLKQRTGSNILEITANGITALEDENDHQKKFRKESVRYWITTGIAILALIISIIALIMQ